MACFLLWCRKRLSGIVDCRLISEDDELEEEDEEDEENEEDEEHEEIVCEEKK